MKNYSSIERAKIMRSFAEIFRGDRDYWLAELLKIETYNTAISECDKTIRALETYDSELRFICNRTALGRFYVSLPYNNPIYSMILYSFGISLVGNDVIVRPSRHSEIIVYKFFKKYEEVFRDLSISIAENISGQNFINQSIENSESSGLLFTGQYNHIENIVSRFPVDKRLIYCGSGINPFIVGSDLSKVDAAVKLAVFSRIYNSGQDCLCSEKFLIHVSVFDEFVAKLVEEVSQLQIGNFGDEKADIFPPIEIFQPIVYEKLQSIDQEGKSIFFAGNSSKAFIAVYEVSRDSTALNSEKFCPIFTLARYKDDSELISATKSDYRFGVTLTAGATTSIWKLFPHITNDCTTIEVESEDAHVPFGGCGKSGFSMMLGKTCDGPILYSVETSQIYCDMEE